jgi:hypothetical protein
MVAWQCGRIACRSVSDTSEGDQVGACEAVARRVGPLRSFSFGGPGFDRGRLATCNGAATHG